MIDPSRPIPDIVKEHPNTQSVFERFGIMMSYKAMQFESLSATAKVHQVDVDTLVNELQQAVSA